MKMDKNYFINFLQVYFIIIKNNYNSIVNFKRDFKHLLKYFNEISFDLLINH